MLAGTSMPSLLDLLGAWHAHLKDATGHRARAPESVLESLEGGLIRRARAPPSHPKTPAASSFSPARSFSALARDARPLRAPRSGRRETCGFSPTRWLWIARTSSPPRLESRDDRTSLPSPGERGRPSSWPLRPSGRHEGAPRAEREPCFHLHAADRHVHVGARPAISVDASWRETFRRLRRPCRRRSNPAPRPRRDRAPGELSVRRGEGLVSWSVALRFSPRVDLDRRLEPEVLELRQDRRPCPRRGRGRRGRARARFSCDLRSPRGHRTSPLGRGPRRAFRKARRARRSWVPVARMPERPEKDCTAEFFTMSRALPTSSGGDVAARELRELGEELLEGGSRHLRGDFGAGAEHTVRAAEPEAGARGIRVAVLLPQVLDQAAREAAAEDRAEEAKLRARGIGELRCGRGEAHARLRCLGTIHDEDARPANRESGGRAERDGGRPRAFRLPVAERLLERRPSSRRRKGCPRRRGSQGPDEGGACARP